MNKSVLVNETYSNIKINTTNHFYNTHVKLKKDI